jgi:hypothetical protein
MTGEIRYPSKSCVTKALAHLKDSSDPDVTSRYNAGLDAIKSAQRQIAEKTKQLEDLPKEIEDLNAAIPLIEDYLGELHSKRMRLEKERRINFAVAVKYNYGHGIYYLVERWAIDPLKYVGKLPTSGQEVFDLRGPNMGHVPGAYSCGDPERPNEAKCWTTVQIKDEKLTPIQRAAQGKRQAMALAEKWAGTANAHYLDRSKELC